MRTTREQRGRRRAARGIRGLTLLVGVFALLGVVASVPSGFAMTTSTPTVHASHGSPQNGSGGGDPPESSTSGGLCASGGPVILGVNWNCVAVLNLTELILILVSIGIVAYVFKDADRAELPGDSAQVPITATELEEYRRARELGIPYDPPQPEDAKGER